MNLGNYFSLVTNNKKILMRGFRKSKNFLSTPKMGVKTGRVNVAFVFVDEKTAAEEGDGKISDHLIDRLLTALALKRDDRVLEGDKDTLKKFGISENEMKTVTKAKYGDLILEKVAMVDIIK